MTTYYGRSGAQSWNTAGAWSNTSGGASNGLVPTAAIDCVLDANTGNMTVNGTSGSPSLGRSLVCTGYAGTLAMGSTAVLDIGDGTAGAFTLVAGMTFTPNVAALIRFKSTTTGNNLTFAAKRMCGLVFDGVGGGWTFQDACNTAASVTTGIQHDNGSVNTNGQAVGATSGCSYLSATATARTLTLGATTWTNTDTSIFFSVVDATNFTMSAASSTLSFTNTTTGFSLDTAALTYGTISCTTLTTATGDITGAFTCATLTLSCGAGTTSQYRLAANATVTGTFTSNGNTVINRAYIRSSTRGTARAITAATVTVTNIDLQDITGAGAGSWNISAVTGLSGDCGGNSSITFTTPASQYWVPSGGTSTGNMSAVTRWANASGGTAGTGRSPLPQDTAVIDANSIDAGSRTLTNDKPRIGAINWTGATNTPSWSKGTTCSFFGSVTLISAMTVTGTGTYTYEGRSTSNITSATKTWTGAFVNDCVSGTGTINIADAFVSASTFTNTTGTFTATAVTTSFSTGGINGGSVTMFQPTFSGTLTSGNGTMVIGAGGGTLAALTKNGTGTMTINGATTASGTIGLTNASGTLNLNANLTGSGTFTTTGVTVNLANSVTLAFNNGSFVSAAGGGGGLACNPLGGFVR